MTTVAARDTTLSFDAVDARYIELAMVGTPLSMSSVVLQEVFAYPSAPQATPPTSDDGYDLTYLSAVTVSANSNMVLQGSPFGKFIGAYAGKTIGQGATDDGFVTLDLGAQYLVSEIDLAFTTNQLWTSGGRLEVAAVPNAWVVISDSGRGQPFGQANFSEVFTFTRQPVRYIRLTDYFVPGVGPSACRLIDVQAY